MSEAAPRPDQHPLADALRVARAALLELASQVSETRIYRVTERPGWTLKHELAALAAADRELVHALVEAARRPGPLRLDLRRRFGEELHRMQELRLAALLEQLDAGGRHAAEAVREHAQVLERPIELAGREASSLATLVHEHATRGQRALATFREHLERER